MVSMNNGQVRERETPTRSTVWLVVVGEASPVVGGVRSILRNDFGLMHSCHNNFIAMRACRRYDSSVARVT
jgi:hypothetical protein